MMKRGLDKHLFIEVVEKLADGKELPAKNRDHALTGNWKSYRECHIQPDWLLIYKIKSDTLILALHRTGSHADLFNM